jgi:hypothetical protein
MPSIFPPILACLATVILQFLHANIQHTVLLIIQYNSIV